MPRWRRRGRRGDACGLAQAAQLRAEQHAQDGRLGRGVVRIRGWPRADRHVSIHYRSDVEKPVRDPAVAGLATRATRA
jgi:hypothetical protein